MRLPETASQKTPPTMRRNKFCATLAAAFLVSSGCSAEAPKANPAKDAEVSIACDKANNTYSLNYTRFAKSQNISGFSLNDSNQLKTTLIETCTLSNGINIETDFDLSRKNDYRETRDNNNIKYYRLENSSLNIQIKRDEKIIGQIIGIAAWKTLMFAVDGKNIRICRASSKKTHCDSYKTLNSAEPFSIRSYMLDIRN